MKPLLTLARLKQLLIYDGETGVFTWASRRGGAANAGQNAGSLDDRGYVRISLDGTRYKAHRLAWLYVYGREPVGEIDHKDRCKSNNRIANLHDVSPAVNKQNMPVRADSTSGLRGVSFDVRNRRWRARISLDGYRRTLGYFDAPDEAYGAYLIAAAALHSNNRCDGLREIRDRYRALNVKMKKDS